MKLDVFGTGDDVCNDNAEVAVSLTLAAGDRLDLMVYLPVSSGASLTGDFLVLGGTGQFAGKGGSGTATIRLLTGAPNVSLTLLLSGLIAPQPITRPSISPSGVVPVGHSRAMIQPGSWISIFGRNLARATASWDGTTATIPTTLGGATATINDKPAYFWYVSPGQINLQAPDDSFRGCAVVRLETVNGTVTTQVQLNSSAPTLSLLDGRYPAAVIPTPAGRGAYGSYDLAGPAGRFSFATRPVRGGESLVLYGTGFGPTSPAVVAGKAFSGAAPIASGYVAQVLIDDTPVPVEFEGLVGAGLFQLNLTVPTGLAAGDHALKIVTPGFGGQTQAGVFIPVQ